MEYIEVSGKTLDDAITEACQKLTVTSDRLDYEVIEKGTSGFLGFAAKQAVIKARIKDDSVKESKPEKKEVTSIESSEGNDPKEFLSKVLK